MRRGVAALMFVGLVGCWSTEPDYVVMQRPPACDLRSQLVRRGFPENLEALFTGNCTVTRMEGMRGPDFTSWLAGSSSAIMSCETQFPVPFWTEKSPEGKITRVHFCPEFCADLLARLKQEIKQDVICLEDAGAGVAGTTATAPSDPGAVTSGFGGGSAFGIPLGGTGSAAGTSGAAGVAAAGSGGRAGVPAAGTAATTAGAGGTSGFGGAAGIAGAGVSGTAGAAGGAGTAGRGGTAGAAGVSGTAGAAGSGG